MENKKSTNRERIARARKIQDENSERKRREVAREPQGLRHVLDGAKRENARINDEALSRLVTGAQWTDRNGIRQSMVGASISYPSVQEAPDLFVRSNGRSIQAINRACRRVENALDLLIGVWRDDPAALPEDLDGHVKKLIGEIPSFDSIKLEIIIEPKAVSPKA